MATAISITSRPRNLSQLSATQLHWLSRVLNGLTNIGGRDGLSLWLAEMTPADEACLMEIIRLLPSQRTTNDFDTSTLSLAHECLSDWVRDFGNPSMAEAS